MSRENAAVLPPAASPPAQSATTIRMDAAGNPRPEKRHLIGFFVMVVGMFMAILDIQIVASSLSEIQAGLGAAPDEIGWVQSSYLIAEVVIIPLSGWLSQVISTRWLFVVSCGGFTLASLACAFSWSIESMIFFRVLQGFLGGAMIPTVFATSFFVLGRDNPRASILMGLIATMGPTLGPTLGGWITSALSWHWLFLLNIAPGILVTLGTATLMDIDRPNLKLLKGFDLQGIFAVAVFLGSMQYVLEEGAKDDWFQSDTIVGFTAAALVGACWFFWRSFTFARPVIDLRVFSNRNFAIGCLIAFSIGFGMYGSVYVLPLFLARVSGYDSYHIGTVLAVTGLCQFLATPIAGILSRKLDPRVVLGIGVFFFALGVYLNTFLTSESGFSDFVLPQAVRGFGIMMCMIPANMLALGALGIDQMKNGSGLYNLMRNTGGAFGLAAINTLLTDRLALHVSRLGEAVNPARLAATEKLDGLSSYISNAAGGTIDGDKGALSLVRQIVQQQASVLAFTDVLLIMAGVFVFVLFFVPLMRLPKAITIVADH